MEKAVPRKQNRQGFLRTEAQRMRVSVFTNASGADHWAL
jgi:hypothetical protein